MLNRSDGDLPAIDLAAKAAFLCRPESYPETTSAVEVVPTHLSMVFLTDRHAYKLKKPVLTDYLDLRLLEARQANCVEELRLNRRLAEAIYLSVVPLTFDATAGLALGGAGRPIEWLLKMVRLPRERMLDEQIRRGRVDRVEVTGFALALVDFYRRSAPVALSPAAYRARFERGAAETAAALAAPELALEASRVAAFATRLSARLASVARPLEERAAEGRIREAHGDLRPEHVCCGPRPVFIDCLEFNRDWRQLDPVDELSYLALECECLGAGWIGEAVLDTYGAETGDRAPAELVRFYKAYRAGVRAKLAAWHLRDGLAPADRARWVARAEAYLDRGIRYAG